MEHYHRSEWPVRIELNSGAHNVLFQKEEIILSSLHMKFGLLNQFMKVVSPQIEAFENIRLMFPNFLRPKSEVESLLGHKLDSFWHLKSSKIFKRRRSCMANFSASRKLVLENRKCGNCKELVANLIEYHRTQGCSISVKLHCSYSHLNFR